MHGNVWECCQDGYAPYDSEKALTDPMGPAREQFGQFPVLRGGAFDCYAWTARSANRYN